MKSNIKVLIARTTLFFACGCLLFLGIVAFAPPSGGQSVNISFNEPHSDGRYSFHLKGKWIDQVGKEHKFDKKYTFDIKQFIDDGNGNLVQKTGAQKAGEIYQEIMSDDNGIPKVDHDGDPSTPEVPLYAVSWSGGNDTTVVFKLTDNNPTQTHDLKIAHIVDYSHQDDKVIAGAAAGYAILAEFVGDITGQNCDDPSQPSRVSLEINGTVAEITLDGEWTREALAQEMVDKLVNLGFRASVVRDTIIHVQTPSDTPASFGYGNTDRGLGVEIDITD